MNQKALEKRKKVFKEKMNDPEYLIPSYEKAKEKLRREFE